MSQYPSAVPVQPLRGKAPHQENTCPLNAVKISPAKPLAPLAIRTTAAQGFAEAARAALIPPAKQLHRAFPPLRPEAARRSSRLRKRRAKADSPTLPPMASAPHSAKSPAAFLQRNRAPKCYLRAGTCLLERAPSQALPLWAADFRLPPTR